MLLEKVQTDDYRDGMVLGDLSKSAAGLRILRPVTMGGCCGVDSWYSETMEEGGRGRGGKEEGGDCFTIGSIQNTAAVSLSVQYPIKHRPLGVIAPGGSTGERFEITLHLSHTP